MIVYPVVIIHGLADARAAAMPGRPVTLLSAPGAALYAGCGWWAALTAQIRSEFPSQPIDDVLDCADGAGQAMAALRIGLIRLVLLPGAPGWDAIASIATRSGGFVLSAAPEAGPVNRCI